MSPQLSAQQVAAFISNIERRRDSTKLEIDSLDRLRDRIPEFIGRLLPATLSVNIKLPDNESLVSDDEIHMTIAAAVNYLTARINWLLVDLEEREFQLEALRYQQSGILIAHPTNNRSL